MGRNRRIDAGVAPAGQLQVRRGDLRRDVSPLAGALATTPSCFLHGDWKAGNLGPRDLVAWRLGMAQLAPFVGLLPPLERDALAADQRPLRRAESGPTPVRCPRAHPTQSQTTRIGAPRALARLLGRRSAGGWRPVEQTCVVGLRPWPASVGLSHSRGVVLVGFVDRTAPAQDPGPTVRCGPEKATADPGRRALVGGWQVHRRGGPDGAARAPATRRPARAPRGAPPRRMLLQGAPPRRAGSPEPWRTRPASARQLTRTAASVARSTPSSAHARASS